MKTGHGRKHAVEMRVASLTVVQGGEKGVYTCEYAKHSLFFCSYSLIIVLLLYEQL